jgi:NSS family neurotransmitter:Na+ symporter
MTQARHENWGSRAGFVLATLGSAVGVGNVWRFSYVAGENGGGAFLVVYLAVVSCVGLPLLIAEFAVGRGARRECGAAFAALVPRSRWRHLGSLGVTVACIVLAYYAVITGWVLKYLALYLGGAMAAQPPGGFGQVFAEHVARPFEPLAWQAGALAITAAIVAAGVRGGIERVVVLLMPALALLLLGLAAYSATLPGFGQGAAFLFRPDWDALSRPGLYLAALGQAFFSIGLAAGVMVTYGSYVPAGQRLPRAALAVVIGDTLFAVAAGLVIFPAVFGAGLDPAQGPALAFVVLPEVFARMPGGPLVGIAFFVLLAIAALTSLVSLLEVAVAFAMQRLGWSRRRASLALGALFFALGAPASLGFGPWSGLTGPHGRDVLSTMDFFAADLLMPLNGLLIAVFVGWVWSHAAARDGAGFERPALARAWRFLLRWTVPLLVGVVLARGVASL